MKNEFDSYHIEHRKMNDEEIDLRPTSLKTAVASPILLNKTKIIQFKFIPIVVKNHKDPSMCVSGKLVYEKKRKAEGEFPTEKLSRQSIKVGEVMEISLDTGETYALFKGLKELYKLYEDIGEIPKERTTYANVDSSLKPFLRNIQSDPLTARMLEQPENLELVKILLQTISQVDSLESLKSTLKELGESNVTTLSNAISIERLERILEILENNIDNSNEEFWQTIFAENQWILSQIFSCPYTIFKEKAYVGGKGLSNVGGNICDFIYQNSLTQNIALIEIKTPCTPLFGNKYRGTYSLSADLSGAINQILNYKDKLTKEYYSNSHNSNVFYEVLSPKCFLIIGRIDGLDRTQKSALEIYRNNLSNVTIITFDELKQRTKDFLALFNAKPMTIEDEEDDITF